MTINFLKKPLNQLKTKQHLTKEGLENLVLIKNFMNKGLTPDLKLAFPNINLNNLKFEAELNCNKGLLSDQIVALMLVGFQVLLVERGVFK